MLLLPPELPLCFPPSNISIIKKRIEFLRNLLVLFLVWKQKAVSKFHIMSHLFYWHPCPQSKYSFYIKQNLENSLMKIKIIFIIWFYLIHQKFISLISCQKLWNYICSEFLLSTHLMNNNGVFQKGKKHYIISMQ